MKACWRHQEPRVGRAARTAVVHLRLHLRDGIRAVIERASPTAMRVLVERGLPVISSIHPWMRL